MKQSIDYLKAAFEVCAAHGWEPVRVYDEEGSERVRSIEEALDAADSVEYARIKMRKGRGGDAVFRYITYVPDARNPDQALADWSVDLPLHTCLVVK